jgi:RNA polymerase sigma-70 factor (ECF subfamily)
MTADQRGRKRQRRMGTSGDWSALERLVADQLPAALAFAQRLTGDPDQAEELVQEALYRASRAWSAFRGEAQPRTWLFRIVINAFRDQAARAAPERLAIDVPDRHALDPADLAAAAELGRTIARLIAGLPPRQREVLVLVSYEGLSTAEIARLLDITEGNVYSTLHAAREQLRRQLEPYLACQ